MPRAGRTCGATIVTTFGRINCPNVAGPTGRCPACEAAHERARGTRVQRGYGPNHDRARREAAVVVASGRALCWRCGEPIGAREEWDLGHDDAGALAGPEHRRGCNRRAAGLKAAGKAWSAAPSGPLTEARARADRAAARRRAREAERGE